MYDYSMDAKTWTQRTRRATQAAGRLAQEHADLVDLMTELLDTSGWAGDGVRSPEHWLQVYASLSPAQCIAVVKVAKRAAELPALIQLMRDGRLGLDQAAQVASHVPAWALDQVLPLAEQTTVTQLSRVVSRYHFDDEPESFREPRSKPEQRKSELTMNTSNGRFRLRFETDVVNGALVEQAIREAKDAAFTAGQENATLADGLIEACSRSLAAVESPSRRDHYRVMLHLDTTGEGWLGKKGAVPPALLDTLTCDGSVRPIWQTDGSPVSVGRSQRIVPARTRKLVEDRDQGCRFPGCQTTGFLENHHLVHWRHGGATDIDTLVSLCPHHHRQHHLGSFTIEGSPTTPDGLKFLSSWGYEIRRVIAPPEPPPPDRPPPERRGTRGERLDYGSITFHKPGNCSTRAPATVAA